MQTRCPPARRLASLLIATFLLLQVVAGFKLLCPPESLAALGFLRVACSPALWPFLDYNMYIRAHHAGEELEKIELVAVWADGRRETLSAARLGKDVRDVRRELIGPLRRGELTAATLAAELHGALGAVPPRIELVRRTWRVVDDGESAGPPRTLRQLDLAVAEGP